MGGSQKEVVVLKPTTLAANQRHTLTVFPKTRLLSIIGNCFATNKSFPLPLSRSGLRRVTAKCLDNPGAEVLIVGHTDTSGSPDVNDPLSLERAKSVKALLKSDADTWLAFYKSAALNKGVWGTEEDTLMLGSLSDFPQRPREQGVIDWFRETRSLDGEGALDEATRRKLIEEYMGAATDTLDGGEIANAITAHGCGARLRLFHLGFLSQVPQEPTQDEVTSHAVSRFKESNGLPADPTRDGPFVDKLVEKYGS